MAESLHTPRKKLGVPVPLVVSKDIVVENTAVDLEDPYKGRNDAVYELFILLFIYILGIVLVVRIMSLIVCADEFLSAFAVRLFSVIRYESIIHEFDP